MRSTLQIPYLPIKNSFDADDITPDDYIKMLEEEHRKTSAMIKGSGLCSTNIIFKPHNNAQQRVYADDVFEYYNISANIFDINGNNETIDNLIRYYQTGEMFIMIIDIDDNENHDNYDDIVSDIRFWVNNSLKIHNDADIDQDSKLNLLPEKTFRLLINRNATAELEGCKLIEEQSKLRLAMIVKKITFLKNNY
jgi:hypothetical protein